MVDNMDRKELQSFDVSIDLVASHSMVPHMLCSIKNKVRLFHKGQMSIIFYSAVYPYIIVLKFLYQLLKKSWNHDSSKRISIRKRMILI